MTETFAALVIKKLIHGQSSNGYLDSLPEPWAAIGQAIGQPHQSPAQRTKAFEAAIAGLPDSEAIRAAVFAADLGADLDELQLPSPQPWAL